MIHSRIGILAFLSYMLLFSCNFRLSQMHCASFVYRIGVLGGTQWQLCKVEHASIRLRRNGMPWRSGGLRIYASSSAAADGNAIARRNNSPPSCTKPSVQRCFGPLLPAGRRHLPPAQICGPSLKQIYRRGADNRACGGMAARRRAESQTRRRAANPKLRVVSCGWPKWREPAKIGSSVPQPWSTLSDRILGGSLGRRHYVRPPGYAGIHI